MRKLVKKCFFSKCWASCQRWREILSVRETFQNAFFDLFWRQSKQKKRYFFSGWEALVISMQRLFTFIWAALGPVMAFLSWDFAFPCPKLWGAQNTSSLAIFLLKVRSLRECMRQLDAPCQESQKARPTFKSSPLKVEPDLGKFAASAISFAQLVCS